MGRAALRSTLPPLQTGPETAGEQNNCRKWSAGRRGGPANGRAGRGTKTERERVVLNSTVLYGACVALYATRRDATRLRCGTSLQVGRPPKWQRTGNCNETRRVGRGGAEVLGVGSGRANACGCAKGRGFLRMMCSPEPQVKLCGVVCHLRIKDLRSILCTSTIQYSLSVGRRGQ